jgi:coproporphyrinogen III oxidase-like Fe-S oxidoreductase
MEGLSVRYVANNFSEAAAKTIYSSARKFIEAGSMVWDGERLKLTRQGKLMTDGIAAELFFE